MAVAAGDADDGGDARGGGAKGAGAKGVGAKGVGAGGGGASGLGIPLGPGAGGTPGRSGAAAGPLARPRRALRSAMSLLGPGFFGWSKAYLRAWWPSYWLPGTPAGMAQDMSEVRQDLSRVDSPGRGHDSARSISLQFVVLTPLPPNSQELKVGSACRSHPCRGRVANGATNQISQAGQPAATKRSICAADSGGMRVNRIPTGA